MAKAKYIAVKHDLTVKLVTKQQRGAFLVPLELADGGPDHPKNVVALCPNCHRRAHYAQDAVSFNDKLKEIAAKAEENALSLTKSLRAL